METCFTIQNLKCGGCANTIVTELSKIEGVSNVIVNNDTKVVSLNFDTETQLERVTKRLSNLGYPLIGKNNSLPKKAKSFVSCAVGRMTK
ncbi:MAG: heavy-metal-associated domain-containing protein [Winogradskyella sp.]|uniref:heavy-metal-associated domain-containing protein n=1 Tax=Winogradskyella sp. TaxID=1883156 RepID=UPI0017903372|nr:heavy-metal-associated domain-containing protein [Winogradskyella sp.]MBT8245388.1 heavy-metal-associated domain-containing protein [Winogradskyella sp.]NNK23609.1 heavy-metal-associated domain-containing protein [Winogradskyella sp.]